MIARYTRPQLAALWSDAARYETWLRVELAACEAMEEAGTVPRGTAAAVRAKAAGKLDPLVSEVFPFAEAAAAMRAVEGGHSLGKVALTLP